jgi:hypothetical protein
MVIETLSGPLFLDMHSRYCVSSHWGGGANECSTDELGHAWELDSIMTVIWLST